MAFLQRKGIPFGELDNDSIDDDSLAILQLPLRWAAARGPWPEQNETNMCEARLKTCLQCVYNSLLDLMKLTIKHSNISREQELFVCMKSNLIFVSNAWNGVGGWHS